MAIISLDPTTQHISAEVCQVLNSPNKSARLQSEGGTLMTSKYILALHDEHIYPLLVRGPAWPSRSTPSGTPNPTI